MGWEQIGEVTGDLRIDLLGGFPGWVGEERGGEAEDGVLTRAAVVIPGEGTGDGSGTGAGEGLSGLLETGDRITFSCFASAGMNGSGKKRTPGDFTGLIYKKQNKKKTEEFRI